MGALSGHAAIDGPAGGCSCLSCSMMGGVIVTGADCVITTAAREICPARINSVALLMLRSMREEEVRPL